MLETLQLFYGLGHERSWDCFPNAVRSYISQTWNPGFRDTLLLTPGNSTIATLCLPQQKKNAAAHPSCTPSKIHASIMILNETSAFQDLITQHCNYKFYIFLAGLVSRTVAWWKYRNARCSCVTTRLNSIKRTNG